MTREHAVTKIRELIETDEQVRQAFRTGDPRKIVMALKRVGKTGGAIAFGGRRNLDEWNRVATQGFPNAAAAYRFVKNALDSGFAVVLRSINEDAVHSLSYILGPGAVYYYTKGDLMAAPNYSGQKLKKFTYGGTSARTSIEWAYDLQQMTAGYEGIGDRGVPRFAVIPKSVLPKDIIKHA